MWMDNQTRWIGMQDMYNVYHQSTSHPIMGKQWNLSPGLGYTWLVLYHQVTKTVNNADLFYSYLRLLEKGEAEIFGSGDIQTHQQRGLVVKEKPLHRRPGGIWYTGFCSEIMKKVWIFSTFAHFSIEKRWLKWLGGGKCRPVPTSVGRTLGPSFQVCFEC